MKGVVGEGIRIQLSHNLIAIFARLLNPTDITNIGYLGGSMCRSKSFISNFLEISYAPETICSIVWKAYIEEAGVYFSDELMNVSV